MLCREPTCIRIRALARGTFRLRDYKPQGSVRILAEECELWSALSLLRLVQQSLFPYLVQEYYAKKYCQLSLLLQEALLAQPLNMGRITLNLKNPARDPTYSMLSVNLKLFDR